MRKLVKTEEETLLAEAARGFLDAKAPVQHLRAMRDAGRTRDANLWAEMADMGWAGILVPEDHGGVDMGHAAAGVLACEMGKTLAASPFLSTAVIAATALRQVAETRANEALEGIAQGALTYGIAVQESRKFDPESAKMPAVADGNGFRLSGGKTFVVDGSHSDRLLVLARTEQGPTLLDIPSSREGVNRAALAMVDSRDAAHVEFNDVAVSGDEVVGAAGQGLDILAPALRAGQAALAAEQLGLATGAVDMTVGYLKERKQFGVPIGGFQALQHRAAKMWCEIEVTSSAVLNAGRVLDADPEDAALAVSVAKARSTETAVLAVQEGVQMHGGIGMTDEYDIGLYMKRARVSAEWLGDYGYHARIVARARGF